MSGRFASLGNGGGQSWSDPSSIIVSIYYRPKDDRGQWIGEFSLHPTAHTVHVGLTTH